VIVVDTSIFIDHLHRADRHLVDLLESSSVLVHPMVIGELALGIIADRPAVLASMRGLPQGALASHDEVLGLVESRELFGRGLGFIDAHLLASTLLTEGGRLWTRDKRLAAAAQALGVGYSG
jgi:hypothetical protein